MKVFSIRDAALGQFGRPFFMVSNGAATRAFADEVNREAQDNQMFQHPEDFDLWELGHFDEDSGKLYPLEMPTMVSMGTNVKR